MKKIILISYLHVLSSISFGQKDSFDLSTFTAPGGWKKQSAETAIQFIKEDAAKGTYCLITLYKAVPGTTNSKENFELAWTSIVKEMVIVSGSPEMQMVTSENGWETQTGIAPFESDGNKGVVLLATASTAGKMVNLIILTNTDVYEKEMTAFLESINLKNPVNKPDAVLKNKPGNNTFITGSWGKSNSISQLNNRFGTYSYNKQQYTFNANGTYTFLGKTYSEDYAETTMIKETGIFTMNGNVLTIIPKTSVIEAWSKKNGADNYHKLISSQKRPLEKASYQAQIEGKNLQLITTGETTRDGRFSNGNYYTYGPPETFTAIQLPGQ